MTWVRLRHVAEVNPSCPVFDRLSTREELTFLPMDAVWPDARLDLSRRQVKSSVAVGFTRFQDGDVVVPKITPTFEAGRSVLVDGLHNGVGAGTTELHVIRAGPAIDARFLLHVVSTHAFLRIGEAQMYGVAGQKRVPDQFIRNLEFELPPREQQRLVADFLDAESKRVGQLSELRRRQAELVRVRFLNSLVGRLLGSRTPDTYTDTWRTTRLKHLFEFERGGVWGDEPSGSNDDVVCVRVADFRRSTFKAGTEATTRRSVARSQLATRLLRKGDVLLEKSGGGEQRPVGFAVSYDGETRSVCSNFVSFLRVKSEHDPRFAALLMGAMYHAGRSLPYIKQTTGIQNLDGPAYLGQQTRIPPLPRQRKIAAEIDTENEHVEALVAAQRRHVALLGERLRALITAAVSGQVDVTTARGVAVP